MQSAFPRGLPPRRKTSRCGSVGRGKPAQPAFRRAQSKEVEDQGSRLSKARQRRSRVASRLAEGGRRSASVAAGQEVSAAEVTEKPIY